MAVQFLTSLRRRALYPCCADDVEEPRRLLAGLVEEIIYCDLRRPRRWKQQESSGSLPAISFIQGDIRDHIDSLPLIHVLFYRRDSAGEGGSGMYILGKQWLERILRHFPDEGGLIITDGSNSGSRIFKKMVRPIGYMRKSWQCFFLPSQDQPWLESHGLHRIEIKRIKHRAVGSHV